MSGRVVVLPVLQEHEERPRPSLLEQPHQAAPQRLALVRGDLVDPSVSVDVGPGDLLEFEVADDVGVNEHAGEGTAGQDEFGDQVDGIVTVTTEVVGSGRVTELLEELRVGRGDMSSGPEERRPTCTDLGQVQTGRSTSVVVLSVHVEDLLAALAEQSTKDTLGEPRALLCGECDVGEVERIHVG